MALRIFLLTWVYGSLAAAPTAVQDFQPPQAGKEHELLKQFEGTWEFTSKFSAMQPGREPTIGKGAETARLIANGLFLVFDIEGDMGGAKFFGHGTMGYDTFKKKYTGAWMDSMSTATYIVEATRQGDKWTEWMEGPDPQSGQPTKLKLILEFKERDMRTMSFFVPGPEGKEIEVGTIQYKRRK